jgi:hypothetical protein
VTRDQKKNKGQCSAKRNHKAAKKERKTLLNPTEEAQTRAVGGHNLGFQISAKFSGQRKS